MQGRAGINFGVAETLIALTVVPLGATGLWVCSLVGEGECTPARSRHCMGGWNVPHLEVVNTGGGLAVCIRYHDVAPWRHCRCSLCAMYNRSYLRGRRHRSETTAYHVLFQAPPVFRERFRILSLIWTLEHVYGDSKCNPPSTCPFPLPGPSPISLSKERSSSESRALTAWQGTVCQWETAQGLCQEYCGSSSRFPFRHHPVGTYTPTPTSRLRTYGKCLRCASLLEMVALGCLASRKRDPSLQC